jgi:hypothetical protein
VHGCVLHRPRPGNVYVVYFILGFGLGQWALVLGWCSVVCSASEEVWTCMFEPTKHTLRKPVSEVVRALLCLGPHRKANKSSKAPLVETSLLHPVCGMPRSFRDIRWLPQAGKTVDSNQRFGMRKKLAKVFEQSLGVSIPEPQVSFVLPARKRSRGALRK